MQNDSDRFFVLTGGPGSGKTTLIEALRRTGFATSSKPGAASSVTSPPLAVRPALGNRALFAELMLSWEMRSYQNAVEQDGPVFFDRGVPDTLGYLRLSGLPVAEHIRTAADRFRYNRASSSHRPGQTFSRRIRTQADIRRGRAH